MIAVHLLSLRRLMAQPLLVILSVVGIAAGVALVVAVNAVVSSVEGSIDELVGPDVGSTLTLTARAPLGFNVENVDRATDDPDVVAATAQVLKPVVVDGDQALLVGRADIPAPLVGTSFGSGPSVTVLTPSGPVNVAVGRAPTDLANLNDGAVLFTPLATAQELIGYDVNTVDTANLTVRPDTEDTVIERLGAALSPDAQLQRSSTARDFAAAQLEPVQAPLLLMATVALITGGFLVFTTVQSSARRQERELALLRALGGTRRQVAAGLLSEALLLGLAGSTLGVTAGWVLGREIVDVLPALVDSMAGAKVRYHGNQQVIPAAIAAGTAVALVAALLPIRSVFRTRPDQVLSRRRRTDSPSSRPHPVTIAVGSAMLAVGAVAFTSNEIAIAQNGLALILFGFLVVGHGLSPFLAGAAATLIRRWGPLGALAEIDIRASGRRVWSTAATVFVAVAIVVALGGATRNQRDTLDGRGAPHPGTVGPGVQRHRRQVV